MALCLAFKKGDRFYVGDKLLTVDTIYSKKHVLVSYVENFIEGVDVPILVDLYSDTYVEVFEYVLMCVGLPLNDSYRTQLLIEAPKDIIIYRDKTEKI